MARKQECIAMLLAGGQGSRLGVLTKNIAKPAVPYGGKYRIIDFPLSNCVNSGIYTVGVLTQYQPLVLNEYIGNGQPWDLDRVYGGVKILPPYQGKNGADWEDGTLGYAFNTAEELIEKYQPNTLFTDGEWEHPSSVWHSTEFLQWLYNFEYDKLGLPCPDLILYLDVPTDFTEAMMRRREADTNTAADIHEQDLTYLATCRRTGKAAAEYYGWTVIQCVRDGAMRSIEDIHEEIYRHVAACLED